MREVSVDTAADAPDMFLLDIQNDQLAGVTAALNAGRPRGGAGGPLDARAARPGRRRTGAARSPSRTSRTSAAAARWPASTPSPTGPALERNETVVDGAAWPATPSSEGEVSIEESIRDRFGIQVGDTMRFDVVGRTVSARVVSVRQVDWRDGRAGGFMFVFRPGLLDQAPHGHIAFVRGPDDARPTAPG